MPAVLAHVQQLILGASLDGFTAIFPTLHLASWRLSPRGCRSSASKLLRSGPKWLHFPKRHFLSDVHEITHLGRLFPVS